MIEINLLRLSTILYLLLASVTGFEAKETSLNENLVTYIEYEKFLKNDGDQRFRRRTTNPIFSERAEYQESVCPLNEVYQACGSKCVLGCRFANTTAGITISRKECNKSDCLAGCFCENGLVRHQSKCIPASECPIQKCQLNEIYQCGPTAVMKKTKNIGCIWGCYCANGYLRNNANGQCIPNSDSGNSRLNKNIPTSRQFSGLYPVRHFFRPPFASNFGFCFGFNCGVVRPQHIAIHNHNVANTGNNGWGSQGNNNGWGIPSYSPYPYYPQAYSFPGYPSYPGYPGVGTGGNRSTSGISGSNRGTTSLATTSNNSNSLGGNGPTNASTGPITITIPNNNSIINNINIMILNRTIDVTSSENENDNENENANENTNDNANDNAERATIEGTDRNATISTIDANIIITVSEVSKDENITTSEINGNVTITPLELDENLNTTAPEMDTNLNITFPQLGENMNSTVPEIDEILNITDPNKENNLNIMLPLIIGDGVEILAPESIGFNVGLRDEPPNKQPKPTMSNNNHQYWNGVQDSTLSGNCIGSNVCNGAGSGVNNKKGSKPPHKNKYATNQYGPPALPINFSIEPLNYFNYNYNKPNRKQSSNKEQDIKKEITTKKPDSIMTNKIPNLTQYIPQPNVYVNTAPNFYQQYFGAVPAGQYQYPTSHISSDSLVSNNLGYSYSKDEALQYPNGYALNSPYYYYADYTQNIQPNNQGYYSHPRFRYQ